MTRASGGAEAVKMTFDLNDAARARKAVHIPLDEEVPALEKPRDHQMDSVQRWAVSRRRA